MRSEHSLMFSDTSYAIIYTKICCFSTNIVRLRQSLNAQRTLCVNEQAKNSKVRKSVCSDTYDLSGSNTVRFCNRVVSIYYIDALDSLQRCVHPFNYCQYLSIPTHMYYNIDLVVSSSHVRGHVIANVFIVFFTFFIY
jgi:hypothetical protein